MEDWYSMSMSGFVRASIAFMTAIVSMYILSITFGAAMDQMYIQFYTMATAGWIPLSASWKGVAIGTLGGWKWFFRSFIVALIAIGVWLVSTIIIDVDYGKKY